MADEEQGTTSETPEQPGTEAPETSVAPVVEDVDPRFKGKSASDLIEHIRNQEKLLGKQSSEVGEIRDLKQQLNSLGEYVRGLKAPERQEQRQVEPQFDITDPDGWIEKKLASRDAKLREEFTTRDNQRTLNVANTNWNRGRDSFFNNNSNKTLYEGIEQEVIDTVGTSFRGKIVTVDELGDPRTWETAAQVVRLRRGEVEKLIRKPGMPAVNVEKPGNSRALDEDEIVLDADDREHMRRENLTEKEAKENIRIALSAMRAGKTAARKN